MRTELTECANALGIAVPKNIGDNLYSLRHGRMDLPDSIASKAPEGKQWVIAQIARSKYAFRLFKGIVRPNPTLTVIKIPDATPEIIAAYAPSDEQALLARLRYNRLIDLFLGLNAYSLQNHLRTTVGPPKERYQIEIDEIYAGINRGGAHFIIPIQAKGEKDKVSPIQGIQDTAYCVERYPNLICRPVAAQFMAGRLIALFELSFGKDEVTILEERHYKLVPRDQISDDELRRYKERSLSLQ
jgi:hypothetical protein